MIKTTPAPAVKNKRLLIVPYGYAFVLSALAIWQLMALEKFIPLVGDYLGAHNVTTAVTIIAMVLIGMEIFSVPFLIRLNMSPLARFCSALFAFMTPLAWAAVLMASDTFSVGYVFVITGIFLLGGLSFWILDGPAVTHLNKKVT